MNALSLSYQSHADKIEKGQCCWIRGANDKYYHASREQSLEKMAQLRREANYYRRIE